ncbi:MAG: hypothetical protein ACQRW7_05870, partial [Caulobacterales bacterium]
MPSRDLPLPPEAPKPRKVRFTGPGQYIVWMAVFLGVVAALAGVLHEPLIEAFQANAAINGIILGVLLIG